MTRLEHKGKDPETGERNVGLYRIQVYDSTTTGMHWQIHKGGGFHYNKAERLGVPLEVAVVIGADPFLLMAAITALPEGMDEISFSGLMRRAPLQGSALQNDRPGGSGRCRDHSRMSG